MNKKNPKKLLTQEILIKNASFIISCKLTMIFIKYICNLYFSSYLSC